MLAREGAKAALFDWELAGENHRDRLERLFGNPMPKILYVRCERLLVSEMYRLRRMVREQGIEFSVFDSVAYACHGAPNRPRPQAITSALSARSAPALCTFAHVNKSETADQKQFGRIF